jgi:hypothetical protein
LDGESNFVPLKFFDKGGANGGYNNEMTLGKLADLRFSGKDFDGNGSQVS